MVVLLIGGIGAEIGSALGEIGRASPLLAFAIGGSVGLSCCIDGG
jgi:hypothetical protein